MGAQVVDYRVSTLVVLCKDCGNDVGLYPARHKCTPIDRPAMPALPAQYKRSNSPGNLDLSSKSPSMTSSQSSSFNESPSTPSTSKWSSSRSIPVVEDNDDSVYFNKFAANLPETNEQSGKKLWGKVRQNDKWKQLSEKNEKPKQSGKLWGKLLQATQTMTEKIPSRDDRGAESDEDDWDGETHVARILREHYEKKHLPLPNWLFDDEAVQRKRSITNKGRNDQFDVNTTTTTTTTNTTTPNRTPSRRRLWDQDQGEKKISSRERERQELRQINDQKKEEDKYRQRGDDRHHEEKYRQRDDDRYHEDKYRQRDDERYHDDRYRQREEDTYHQRDDNRYRQRDNDRYRQEDEYRQRDDNRYRQEDKYHQRDDDRYRQEDKYHQRDDDRYRQRDHYQKDEYHKDDRYHQARSDNHYNKPSYTPEKDHHRTNYNDQGRDYHSRHYEEERSYTRPLSPPRPQQRSNSTSRQRVFEDSSNYQPIRSGRSIRGYKDTTRHENNDLDNYYSGSRQVPPASRERANYQYNEPRRERRYVNENNYF